MRRASFCIVNDTSSRRQFMVMMPKLRSFLRTLLVVVTLLAAARALAQTDADVLRAKDAFDRGDQRRLDALAPPLSGHILAPYVTYWQLKLSMDSADPAAVRRFLAREAGSPLADRLRGDWLKSLGKREEWSDFDEDYVALPGEDLELTCYAVQRRRMIEGDAALAAVRPAWLTGQSTPDACDPLFAALFARGDLTDADRRARMRLASEAGNTRLAEALGGDLPGHERITAREFAAVTRDPVRALHKGAFAWKTPAGRDLALYALERAARKDVSAARAAWVKWRDHLPAHDRAYGNRRLAYHAARALEPVALDWFREAGAPTGSPEELAWRIRAALRAQAWRDVLATIAALPDADQQDPAWRYWKARALAATGRKGDADAIFTALTATYGFYGQLAAEALGQGAQHVASLQAAAFVPDAGELASFSRRYDVQRVVKLIELDLRTEALREWAYIVREQPDERLLLAAEFARRAGLYDRAINAAERTATRHDFAMRYLTPFRPEFTAAARDQGVDEALLYGIARQESRFVPDIVSSAGAVGLMQLMPRTARWVARKMARTDFSPAQIASAELNTQFGAFYFRYWHDRFGERPALTAAAYNAGPSRAQAWRPAAAPLEGAIWVETIPFSETRDYVKKVLANTVLYARALNLPYVSLTDRLGTVTPRGSDNDTLASQSP
jgi:soluble lytic murein transglycosylase